MQSDKPDLVGFEPLLLGNCDHCAEVYYLYGRKGDNYGAVRVWAKSCAWRILETIREVGVVEHDLYVQLQRDIAASTMPDEPPEYPLMALMMSEHDRPLQFQQMYMTLTLLMTQRTQH